MRILHVVTALGLGGVERLLLALAEELARTGERCEIAFLKAPETLRDAFEQRGIRVHELRAPRLSALPRAARKLRELLRRERIDLVHSHLLQGDLVATLATRGERPLVRAQHNVERALQRPAVRWLYRRLLAGRSPLVVPSAVVARFLVERCSEPPELLHVLPYGLAALDTETAARAARERPVVRARWGLGERERAALVLARIAPQKGQLELLRALRRFPPLPRWVWILAGETSDARYARALARELRAHPWRERVRWVGPMLEPEHALHGADALCLPSLWEGLGLAALEALRAGLPVVAHDLPVFREVLRSHALFVPLGSGAAWIDALRALDAEPEAAAARAATGQRLVREAHSLARYAEALRALYAEQLRGAR